MNYTIVTLGCKVNQYESQAMEQWLAERGHTEVGPGEDFDLAIVNTCTVTAVADKKNRNVIRRLRKQCPEAVLAVCGCYSQVKPEDVRALGVDVISGSGGREAFLALVLDAVADRQKREALDEALRRRSFEILPPGGLATRTRAMLKVQDGCSNFCSYCIIPYARGPVRSLPLEQALVQVQELAEAGYREIVVTGIEIASWGVDLDKTGALRLPQLLDAICKAAGDIRIRLGSLEPRIIDERFCQLLKGHSNLCPHFHLSMQSGSDTVLARMHRHYDTARYLQSVRLLEQHFPACAITTDMIVGFPGETEAEFAESLDFIRQCGFASMHIFPYSRRPGTPADKLPGQLGNAVKEARSAAAIAVAAELNRHYREAMIGSTQQVLFEETNGAFWTGHAPNSIRVYAPGQQLHNQVLPVRITGLFEDGVLGERLLQENP
ncbi:MAG: tRNA (N(6)-L-threonylcarbamoyladenosine(37)-C(2))-methylthiotransferase MtaB [Oscillospiraceae bacterium]|nr:tRNA (N(6)-L-threonylcarbamoyladenosine(37)-C(2))-methylthiotransferase MtaB [Oscillospiraceae bacterium]